MAPRRFTSQIGIGRRALAAGLAAAIVTVMAIDAAVAAATPETIGVRTLITRVSNQTVTYNGTSHVTSAMGGLEIVGAAGAEDAYVVKSDQAGENPSGWATLYHINNFGTTNTVTAHVITMRGSNKPANLGHANGLAYYRTPGADYLEVGSFYIATLGQGVSYQVAQVNSQGEITKTFGASTVGGVAKNIASITYYGGGVFIVGTNDPKIDDPSDSSRVLKTYYTATISGNQFKLNTRFYVPTARNFATGQDIYYDSAKDELNVPVWDGPLNNRIIVVELDSITANRKYEPKRWIRVNVSTSDAAKFELEGIDRNAAGNLFVSSNIVNPAGEIQIDGVHKITGS